MSEVAEYPFPAGTLLKEDTSFLSRRRLQSRTMEAIQHTHGPLVEIGGPTPQGYLAIDQKQLPHGLVIANVEPTQGANLLCDVRKMPFTNSSIGGILMAGLTRIPEELAQSAESQPILNPGLLKADSDLTKLVADMETGDYSGWADSEVMNHSLRLALLK